VRSEDQSILTVGVFSNRLLIFAGLTGIALVSCISYLPARQHIFGTAGLTAWDWLIITGFGLGLLAADESRKAVARHRRTGPEAAGRNPDAEAAGCAPGRPRPAHARISHCRYAPGKEGDGT
jgi:Ca2+-transporting ATPase